MADTAPAPTILSKIAGPILVVQHWLIDIVNPHPYRPSSCKELDEILLRSKERTDIRDHLGTMFTETMESRPKLIVELGVRTGESTFVFERAARLLKAKLVSVDIDDCGGVCKDPNWTFVKTDDIVFAKQWPDWTKKQGIQSEIDLLFIDTSHIYEHTVQEIKHWFPLLAPNAKVMFHDTNQRKLFFRKDGSMGLGWNNNRGVMAAIEEHLGTRFNEAQEFSEYHRGWVIRHVPYCSGFTVLTKVGAESR